MAEEAAAYEQEQEALQRELDGVGPEIKAPREPEVNPEVYKDVEPLLSRGFLTLPGTINGVPFIFKSLNHHEFELLRLSVGMYEEGAMPEVFWDRFLAYGVLMVDAQNVLSDRGRWVPELAEMFGDLHTNARGKVIRYLSEVNRRATNAVTLTEVYCLEVYSRYRWAQMKGLDLTSPAATGIEGTQHLGLNWAQQMWRAVNYFEDRNDQHERDWENAKFVGSCMAGKGISKVYQQDTERREKDRDAKFARKDKLLREVLLGEKSQDTTKQGQAAVMTAAHTVEELATQLEMDLKGEKDWHDQVVENQERHMRANIEGRQEQIREFAKAHEEEFGEKNILSEAGTEGLTAEQVQELITRKKQHQAQNIARRIVRPEMDLEQGEKFLGKWGAVGPEVGANITSTDRDPSEATPIVTPVRTGKPFRGKK